MDWTNCWTYISCIVTQTNRSVRILHNCCKITANTSKVKRISPKPFSVIVYLTLWSAEKEIESVSKHSFGFNCICQALLTNRAVKEYQSHRLLLDCRFARLKAEIFFLGFYVTESIQDVLPHPKNSLSRIFLARPLHNWRKASLDSAKCLIMTNLLLCHKVFFSV